MIVYLRLKRVRLIHRYLLPALCAITIGLVGCTAAANAPDARSATAAPGKQAAADAAHETVPQSRECLYGAGGCCLGTEFSSPMPCWLAVPVAVVCAPLLLPLLFIDVHPSN